MNDRFSFKRVGLLLRYDWANYKKILMFSVLTIEILYIIITVWTSCKDVLFLENPPSDVISKFSATLIDYNFTYSGWMIGVLTGLGFMSLSNQFSLATSATRYMMVPTNLFEKYNALHIKLIIGIIVVVILTYLNSIIFKLIFIPSPFNQITTYDNKYHSVTLLIYTSTIYL